MIDWPALFRDWITPIIAVTGLSLSVWARVDKWREDRKKEAEALPWARLELGAERVESDTHSARPLFVKFENPTRHRWKAVHVQIIDPGTALIRKRKEPGPWVCELDLDWIITSVADDGDGKSQGNLAMRFERQAATGEPSLSREVALRVTIQEVSSKRRRHKFEARTVRHF